jgi:hypothetical protein
VRFYRVEDFAQAICAIAEPIQVPPRRSDLDGEAAHAFVRGHGPVRYDHRVELVTLQKTMVVVVAEGWRENSVPS